MATLQQIYNSLLKLKKSIKKLAIAPSTRKSWCQILVTLLISFFLVRTLVWVDNKQKDDNLPTSSQPSNQTNTNQSNNNNSSNNESSDFSLLEQVQNFSVISAAILFFWDTFDRKKQLERQAWQLIDGAQGSETSGARKQAIEELYEEGSDITGLDADGADLRGIKLRGADLTRASFKNAILEGAIFDGATLTQANFQGANLKGASFKKATLLGTIFTKSDLSILQIDDTDINSSRAGAGKQIKADFRDANLSLAIFDEARLAEAIFGRDEPETSNKSQLFLARASQFYTLAIPMGTDTKLRSSVVLGTDGEVGESGGGGREKVTCLNATRYETLVTGILLDRILQNQDAPPLGSKTKLIGSRFWDANLNKVNLIGVDIEAARFGGAKVEPSIILQARKETIAKAFYDKEFLNKNKQNNNFINVDEKYYKYKQSQHSTVEKLLKITQHVSNNKLMSSLDEDTLSDILVLLKLLKDFIRDSGNSSFIDNELFDQVLKVEDAVTQREKSYRKSLEQLKDNQDLITELKNLEPTTQDLLKSIEKEDE